MFASSFSSSFPASILACIVAVSAALPSPAAAQEAGDPATGQRLLGEGDALADEGKYDDAVMKYMDAYEALLPSMRRLPFKREVKGHFTARKELQGILQKMVDEEIKPEDLRGDELTLKALGLAPKDLDLKQTMVRMMTEEVAGFYDSEKETMHLIHEELAPPKAGKKEPGLFDRLFGPGDKGKFDKDQNKMVLAHELTHALADQHFDLDKLREAAKDDGDRELALVALIEGEAVLTMIGAAGGDWDGTATAQMPARQLSFMMNMMGPMMTMGGGAALKEAPPVLSETLIFPYARGVVFAAHLTNAGGWAALDRAYASPPLSTEQIMHPEKYVEGAKNDPPTAIDLGELKPGDGWNEVARDVLGELVTGIMLRGHGGRTAAAGWDGDSVVVYEGAEDKLALVWLTTWDTEQDAREFARGYASFQAKKFNLGDAAKPDGAKADGARDKDDDAAKQVPSDPDHAPAGDGEAAPKAPAGFPAEGGDDGLRREHAGAAQHIEIRGSDVAVVEGFSPETTDALVKVALAAKKTQKSHEAGAEKPD